jgi:HK97 family phage major capsid protein
MKIEGRKALEALLARHLAAAQTRAARGQSGDFLESEEAEQTAAKAKLEAVEAELAVEQERIDGEKARVAALPSKPWPADLYPPGMAPGATETGERGTFARALGELLPVAAAPPSDSVELLRAVLGGHDQSRVLAQQGETISSEGGFAIGPELSRRFWNLAGVSSVAFSWFRVEPMMSSEKIVPMLDDFDRSGDEVAGVEGQWVGEGSTITVDKAKLAKISLHARKTAVLVEVPRELFDDAAGSDLAREFERAMRDAISLKIDKAVLNNGTGAGQPLSILNSDALVSVTRDSAGVINYEDLTAMLSRLPAESQARYIWIGSPSIIPKLYTLNFAIGTGGSAPSVFSQGADGSFRLFGRPLVFSPRLPSLGTVGDLMAVDPTQYVVGLRSSIQVARSDHYGFNRDVVALRALVRVDGQPAWKSARTDEDAVTRSPFVAIAT